MAATKIHADYAGTADYARIGEWAQLNLQSIQHRDYFGHLSISCSLHSYQINLVQKWTSDYTELLNLDKIQNSITLGFAKNGCFTNEKGMEKLCNLDSFQGIDHEEVSLYRESLLAQWKMDGN